MDIRKKIFVRVVRLLREGVDAPALGTFQVRLALSCLIQLKISKLITGGLKVSASPNHSIILKKCRQQFRQRPEDG